MAAGDAVVGFSTAVANNGFVDIQPGAAIEWVIHNIYYEGAVEIYWYDGSTDIKFDADTTAGARLNLALHCTNAKRIRVKNVSGGAQDIGYDGMVTK
jgi:hypothetical protein